MESAALHFVAAWPDDLPRPCVGFYGPDEGRGDVGIEIDIYDDDGQIICGVEFTPTEMVYAVVNGVKRVASGTKSLTLEDAAYEAADECERAVRSFYTTPVL